MDFNTCDVETLLLFKKDAENKNDLKQRRLLKLLLKNLINEGETILKNTVKNKSDKVTVKRLNTKITTTEIQTPTSPELNIKLEPAVKTSTSSTLEAKLQSPPELLCTICAKPFDSPETHKCNEIEEINVTEICLSESETQKTEDIDDVVMSNSDSETIDKNDWFEANFDLPENPKKVKPKRITFKNDYPLYKKYLVFECSICGQNFPMGSEFDEHLKTNSSCADQQYILPENGKKFKCKQCSKYLPTVTGLKNHIRIFHSEDSPEYSCDKCNREFGSKRFLEKHVIADHELKLHLCHICNKSYSDKHKLERHINSVHLNLCTTICPVCGKVLGEFSLERHMVTHSDMKHFKCDQCTAAFKLKMDLTTHLRLHTGERPYSCTVCLKKFINNSSLHKHMRSHGDYVVVKNEGFKK